MRVVRGQTLPVSSLRLDPCPTNNARRVLPNSADALGNTRKLSLLASRHSSAFQCQKQKNHPSILHKTYYGIYKNSVLLPWVRWNGVWYWNRITSIGAASLLWLVFIILLRRVINGELSRPRHWWDNSEPFHCQLSHRSNFWSSDISFCGA